MNNLIRKNILWISDYSTQEYPFGGAEISDSILRKEGRKRLANIDLQLCNRYSTTDSNNSDLVIISNNLNLGLRDRYTITKTKRYICIVQDCGRWLESCLQTPGLLKNSALNIYMSPGQEKLYLQYFPEQRSVCIPPCIPEIFTNKKQQRINKALYVGFLHEGKGIQNILDYSRYNNVKVDIYGYYQERKWLDKISALNLTKYCGTIAMNELPEIYNKYKYYIQLPNIYESFSRTTAEALMCGCEIIHNNKLGIFSYTIDTKGLIELVSTSDKVFWNTVNNLF